MHTRTTPLDDTAPARRMTRHRPARAAAVASVAITAFALTSCGTTPEPAATEGSTEPTRADEAGLASVLFLGDSVAAGQAVALQQGIAESGAKFIDATSTGGGNLVGPNAEEQWRTLPDTLGQAEGDTVIYQVTTYDWGTPDEQRDAYVRLADATAELGTDLAFVSMPPIQADEFYEPHMDELTAADEAAQEIADGRDDVEYLDASAVWGDEYAREHDGRTDRSDDGIHTCPQGAARFTDWTLEQLAELYPGFTPAGPETWANTGWADSDKFHGC